MHDPVALLQRHFGYPAFRPGQEDLVRAALSGRDALGVLPTGGGKSVCYQVPALALDGLVLVITPLVSLMEDQVGRARAGGLRAAHLSATQSTVLRRETLEAARSGCLDVLFVAPERLELPSFRQALDAACPRLLAVDEAHSISEWGDDFRPSYRKIGEVRERLGCPVLALTATATPRVREDIAASLRLRDPLLVVKSFDRPNLSWSVLRADRRGDRTGVLHELLRRHRGTAIVYAPTRRSVETVRDALARRGLLVEAYHAGLPGEERSRVQEIFMSGACRVVVATNAFGMGIDKADVRLVAHVQLPATLEAYYQEAGRAGRDGEPSMCVAFHHRTDRRIARGFIDRTHPPSLVLGRLWRRLRNRSEPGGVVEVRPEELRGSVGPWASPEDVVAALEALARTGAVRLLDGRAEAVVGTANGGREGPIRIGVRGRIDATVARILRRSALARLAAVQRYARGRGCRRRALLAYFGEEAPPRCGSCDRCLGRSSPGG